MAPSTRPAPSSSGSLGDTSESVGDWVRLHARHLGAVALVGVAVGAGAWLWRSSARSTATRAEQAYLSAQVPLARGDAAAAERELRQVAQRYDGTSGGVQAQLLLAQLLYEQGKYQDGLKILDQASDAPESMREGVRTLIAGGYEGVGRPREAARIYESLAASEEARGRRGELLADAARAYQAANDRESARKLWSELATLEGEPRAEEARVRLGELTAAPVGR